ncbi:ABC transporter permease [Mycoplasma sp. ATU-Cv-508]|uniref:ABC transporter permease subunit n=1 Tax=Mycoplasma sp. ATU-Cv-508 TaxID=2048001 RepID=UPI001374BE52
MLAIFFGFLLGALAGYKRGTWVDALINVFVIFFSGVPAFILAALALALGGALNWPTAFVKPENGGYKQMIISLMIPIAVMSLSSLAIYTYYTRNEIVSVLNSNQVMIARSKGLDEWQVFKKHVARNVAIPLVSIIVPSFSALLAGSIVIETFFQIPGSSQIIVNAVKDAEYNVVMFNTLFFVSLGLLLGIITDMVYLWLDPRIKYASATDLRIIRYLRARRQRKSNQKIGVSRAYETLEGDK